ncbi:MAG: hypothetical protein OEW11_09175 [Nitrospirota bacterium]|nr:hypothetical protein [Nitrospirota bacterium]
MRGAVARTLAAVSSAVSSAIPPSAAIPQAAPRTALQKAPEATPTTALEAELTRASGRPVQVTLTQNRRRLVSVERQRRGDKIIRVRMHQALLEAPRAVRAALEKFVVTGCATSGRTLRDHLMQHLPDDPPRPVALRPRGHHHHLGRLLAEASGALSAIAAAAAPGAPASPNPAITWGPRRRPGARQVRLGSYDAKRALIRINPVLDHPAVPDFVLRHVVYHELLHHFLVQHSARGERHHGARFRALEARYPDMERSTNWQREELSGHLARARKRSR